MKTILSVLIILFISLGAQAQTSTLATHKIYCENIHTLEASNDVKNYLLTNYSDRITDYQADLDKKWALITTDLEAIDLLQLYRMQGYIAIYLSDHEGRFHLNDSGELMIGIKE